MRPVLWALIVGAALLGNGGVVSGDAPDRARERGFRLELPAALYPQSSSLFQTIQSALDAVVTWFTAAGLPVQREALIRRAVVFDRREVANKTLAKVFGQPEKDIPASFSGTVQDDTLYVVSPALFRSTWEKLYPDWPWREDEYRRLIVHEVAHRAHALLCRARFGSEDAMGPQWFFEGFAIACAGQFLAGERPEEFFTWDQIRHWIGRDGKPTTDYRILGRVVRSLGAAFPWPTLVAQAHEDGFPDALASTYLPSRYLLEPAASAPVRGTILLIHGSAPFDVDGRIPGRREGRYAGEPFFRDLGRLLRAGGWNVLRYSKPGVLSDRVDRDVYATTDLAHVTLQLANLWRSMPSHLPRVALAWSEGSLHLRALPLEQLDAVIVLGGVAGNIADVIAAQGGPSRQTLLEALSSRPRLDMADGDRPVGRLIDELQLGPNWQWLAARPGLPALILHGGVDAEVPVAQAALWKEKLGGRRNVTVVVGQGLDHRFMPPGRFDPSLLGSAVLSWLGGLSQPSSSSHVRKATTRNPPGASHRCARDPSVDSMDPVDYIETVHPGGMPGR